MLKEYSPEFVDKVLKRERSKPAELQNKERIQVMEEHQQRSKLSGTDRLKAEVDYRNEVINKMESVGEKGTIQTEFENKAQELKGMEARGEITSEEHTRRYQEADAERLSKTKEASKWWESRGISPVS